MNNNVKTMITLAIGAGIGSVATVMIMKNKYEQIIQEELYSIRETRERREKRKEERENPMSDETVIVDYNEIAGIYNQGPMSDDEREAFNLVTTRIKSEEEPYVISIEEFSDEMQHFEKETLLYYMEDGILSDNNDEVIEDISKTIGDEALNSFGMESDDEDIVYIRNEKMGTDYEVIRQHKSYEEHMA